MCGLFGFYYKGDLQSDPALMKRAGQARDCMAHRGPDQAGECMEGGVYLGHRRLSILDLTESGRQPMISDDGAVAITVNGEIYNFKDLRRELGEAQFKSTSDSEVVLHGYRRWGLAALADKMDGMYAIVIHDRVKGQVHLLRDRAGVKQLYYGQVGPYFLWASELKSIAHFLKGTGLLQPDETALYDFLTYRYIPAPKSIYKNVRKLETASNVSFDCKAGSFKEQKYWSLNPAQEHVDHDKAAAILRELCFESVAEQMVSDVPLGFFLSGGLDSSVVVASAAQAGADIHSFSIGFDVKSHDETEFADIVAKHCTTRHHKQIMSVEDSEQLLELLHEWYDEPFADSSALSTFYVSRFARNHVTVALSGDGGDELFGGYNWYRRFLDFNKWQSPLRPVMGDGAGLGLSRGKDGLARKILSRVDLFSHGDPLQLYALLLGGIPVSAKKHYRDVLGIEKDYDDLWRFRPFWREDLPLRKRMQFLDCHTFLPDDILVKVDRVSMAVSLESRVPLLSRKIMEYAFSLPEDFIYKNGELKGGFKYAFKDLLPDEILTRRKKGFSVPLHHWWNDKIREAGSFEEIVLQGWLRDLQQDQVA